MVKHQKTIEQIAGLALIVAIVIGCGFVLRPFVSAILWAAILCFATWPVHEVLLRWLHGWRNLTAGLMTILLSLVLIIPFVVVGLTFTDSVRSVMDRLESKDEPTELPVPPEPPKLDLLDPGGEAEVEAEPADPNASAATPPLESDTQAAMEPSDPNALTFLPPPPAWVERIPWIGERVNKLWLELEADAGPMLDKLRPRLEKAGLWLLGRSLDLAQGVLQLILSVLIAFFLYRDGEGLVARLREGFQRISGDYAQHLMNVVKATVGSVVYGVIGTGLAQGIVAGIGFAIARVPSPMLLAVLTFFLSFVPFGPPIIWIGASVWLFAQERTGWGIFMALYGLLGISSVDNLVKPYIISRGSRLPFIVMFLGVLGGVAAFGFIGIFLGPTLLAVGFSLAQEILGQRRTPALKLATKPAEAAPVPTAPAPTAAAPQVDPAGETATSDSPTCDPPP